MRKDANARIIYRAGQRSDEIDFPRNGPVLGYVVMTLGFSIEYGGCDAFIDELYVVPSARDRGLGAVVLDFIESKARALGLRALHREVMRGNGRALHLYRKHGYDEVDRHLMNKWL